MHTHIYTQAPELVSRMCSETNALKTFSIESSLDVWSFGVIVYELCSGNRLFSLDLNNDEIQDPLDLFRLCVWSHVHRDMMSKVFLNAESSKTHPSLIFHAKHLISCCLEGDPRARPTSKDLVRHPFIVGDLSSVQVFNRTIRYHAFVSHAQMEASGEAAALDFTLRRIGVYLWRDMSQSEITEKGMRDGVRFSDVFIMLLTESTLSRYFCLKEFGWALDFKKRIIIVVESNPRFAAWDYDRWTRNETIKNTYGTLSTKFQ